MVCGKDEFSVLGFDEFELNELECGLFESKALESSKVAFEGFRELLALK